MEAAAGGGWSSDVGMKGGFFHQWGFTDQFTAAPFAAALGQDFQRSLPSASYNSFPWDQRPKRPLEANSWSSCTTEQNSGLVPNASSPTILSFGNPDSSIDQNDIYEGLVGVVKPKREMDALPRHGSKRSYDAMAEQRSKAVSNGTRSTYHKEDHIIAERKRREKLTQRFIALSAMVPGLKKMDKASVLGDAINYLKQLEEKVKILEDQAAQRTVESAVLVKKSRVRVDGDSSSHDENLDGLPQIEAKMSGKTVLVKIHCDNRKGVLVKLLSEIENLHLSVANTSAMSFVGSSLDITVMAQVEEGFDMTVKDVVTELSSAFRQLT
ncbi:unnamed protein product [Musa textilis]